MSYDFDLFVIGAGSGGVRASRISAQLGARVAIAENLYLGGTCVNVGCVPKKIFVYGSEFSENFSSAKNFGWDTHKPRFNWPVLRDNKSSEIERLNGIYANLLDNAGVTRINGKAQFVDAHTVEVNGERYSAEKVLIATGGWPKRPNFEGSEHLITSNEVFSLDTLPKRVLVQGGGYIAVEFAGIFNGFGVNTELLYRGGLFLRGFDQELREFVAEQVAEKGIKLSFNSDIQKIEKQSGGELHVTLTDGSTREVDAVFSAIGRIPKIDGLGLDAAGVKLDERGYIGVNESFQTNVENIYAVGDVIGRVQLTPVALMEGMALAKHWFDQQALKVDYDNIATAVFCQPNIGTVGLSEEQARERDLDIDVYVSKFTPLKNTISGKAEKTLMKLIVNKENNAVIGAHMVGPEAGEIVQGLAIAIKSGATKADFDNTIGIHPTAAEEFVTMRVAR